MSVVLETCTILDLSLNEDDIRYKAIDKALCEEICYVTPLTLAETYRRVRDDISLQRAELMFDAAISGAIKVFTADSSARFLKLLIDARDFGAPYIVAQTAALASFLDIPVLTNEVIYETFQTKGFCRIRTY